MKKMQWKWMLLQCFYPTVQQVFISGFLILCPCIFLRYLVLFSGLQQRILNIIATILGVLVLWWHYDNTVVYFAVFCAGLYTILVVVDKGRGAAVSISSLVFIFSCELLFMSNEQWNKVKGSFLVVIMKNISLAFDLESQQDFKKGEKKPPRLANVPDLTSYTSYCLFPGTTLIGPFVTYKEHRKFLNATPISLEWVLRVLSSLVIAAVCLGLSVCILPFLFNEPQYNKWVAAYTASASFRCGHYFVLFLSQSSTIASGIGYELNQDKSITWSSYSVIHPMSVEIPWSLSLAITKWNLPMYYFLKEYVYKPSWSSLGQSGATLLTFSASVILHGLNSYLTASMISAAMYTVIEMVFRRKLSMRLDACVLDRPCKESGCNHHYKSTVWWVLLINVGFILLNIFHNTYLGQIFEFSDKTGLTQQGFSLMYTLEKWAHLNFLSHWVALGTLLLSWIL